MIKSVIYVGLGGAIGSILRYLTYLLTAKFYSNAFPLATLIINILGCFIIGLLIGVFEHSIQPNQHLRLLLLTGFCGGYTTFSAFTSENMMLLQTNNYLSALLYIAASIVVSLFAIWLGLSLTK
ncbi:MAG: fluoride efflux transporter CrcB [Bacteroidia bacterium]